MQVQVYESAQKLVACLSDELQKLSELKHSMHIALSGGSTPRLWFDFLAASPFRDSIDWQHLHFWWGDERCVEAASEESNFGEADRRLFQKVMLAAENLHPVKGELTPEQARADLVEQMEKHLPIVNGLPQFDWVLLGVGEDGHTASLFPGQYDPEAQDFAVVANHPETAQPRVSVTAAVIANARRVSYLVLGPGKQQIVQTIFEDPEQARGLPAASIRSIEGTTEYLLDADAAALLRSASLDN